MNPAGAPEARVVVLRGIDRAARRFRLHTDRRSGKVVAIAACPWASLLFWDPRRALQLRVAGRAEVRTAGPEVAAAWARVPEPARTNYRTQAAPGSSLAHGGPAPESGDGAANFVLVDLIADSLDLLWLGPEGHRRAGWTLGSEGWTGGWRVP